jgi:hypothetical protein
MQVWNIYFWNDLMLVVVWFVYKKVILFWPSYLQFVLLNVFRRYSLPSTPPFIPRPLVNSTTRHNLSGHRASLLHNTTIHRDRSAFRLIHPEDVYCSVRRNVGTMSAHGENTISDLQARDLVLMSYQWPVRTEVREWTWVVTWRDIGGETRICCDSASGKSDEKYEET